MFRKIIILVFLFMSELLVAQVSRTDAMGGLTFSIFDRDQVISPYHFGNNPAWLYMGEQETFLKIAPSLSNSWGDYRRKYDSEGVLNLGTTVHGIKTLGSLGTFSGFTSYKYENRRNVYRTLKKDTYYGEGFFINDTTASDIRYMGPKVILMYSWELFDNLFVGGNIYYELLDGLKEQYSYAKTIYRDTEIKIGLAYKLGSDIVLGADLEYIDSQESIEATDVNLLDVEMFYFRGDRFFVSKRGSSMVSKIRKQGYSIGSQLMWENGSNISVGAQVNYSPSDSKILRPYYNQALNQSLNEAEDSYASFNRFDAQLKAQYKVDENLLFGIYAGYFNNYSWSRISLKDLLMWEWENKLLTIGAGAGYSVSPSLLVGFEYQLHSNAADSSKYIDKRFTNLTSTDHYFRIGAEYKLADDIFLRTGFNYGMIENDLIFGGKDCTVNKLTCGLGFPFFNLFTVDANIQYNRILPKAGNITRSYLSGNFTIMLKTF